MQIGCCTSIDRYDELYRLGYENIVLAGKDLAAMDEEEFLQTANVIERGLLGLHSLNAFCPPALALNGAHRDLDAVRAYTRTLCSRAQKLGVCYIGIGSPASRNVAAGYDPHRAREEFKETLTEICGVAQQFDIDILLEAVEQRECNFINTTKDALALIEELKIGNLHLVYDIYHSYWMREPFEWLEDAISEIRCVHIAGTGIETHPYLCPESMQKLWGYLSTLIRLKYNGEIALEAFSGRPEIGLRQSLELLRQYLDQMQGHAGAAAY